MKKMMLLFLSLLFLLSLAGKSQALESGSLVWTQLSGTSSDDAGYKVAVDCNGNIYIAGYTTGSMYTDYSVGGYDLFVSKYNSQGRRLWTEQTGSVDNDSVFDIATDNNGNVYLTGGWASDSSYDNYNYFLTKYDTNGKRIWLSRSGTTANDISYSLALDPAGNIYLAGFTWGNLNGNSSQGGADIFLSKYDNDGNQLWTKQTGSGADDIGHGVALDNSGNIYVTGYTSGGLDSNNNLGAEDIFLIKFDNDGNKLWTRQDGTGQSDFINHLAIDNAGDIYLGGNTAGGLDGNSNQGEYDTLLIKYDNAGNKLWTRQTGTSETDVCLGIAADTQGNIFITGNTAGSLDGNTNQGAEDIFLIAYDNAGNKLWTRQPGTGYEDSGCGVVADTYGNVYVSGYVGEDLNGNDNQGGKDILLQKYNILSTVMLSWPAESEYSGQGLYPVQGEERSIFTFKIVYTEAGDKAPLSGYPKVHIEKDSQEISGSPFVLTEADPADYVFSDGKTYLYQTSLPLGTDYTYWFEAYNSSGFMAGGLPTGNHSGPAIENIAFREVYTYPNPAKAGRINFHFYCGYPDPEFTIRIYDVSGEKVATIPNNQIDKSSQPLYYCFNWPCQNDSGEALASGVYIYLLEARDATNNNKEQIIKKFAIIK